VLSAECPLTPTGQQKVILMSVWAWLKKVGSRKKDNAEDPYSIVLLLREPHFFTSSELEAAGERGFDIKFDGKQDPMYFVSQTGPITFLKAGKHAMHFLHARTPYLEPKDQVARKLPREEQRIAWMAHSAWASVDMLNRRSDIPKREAYSTLARFVLFLGDANCSGIYLPGEQIMMPNDGTAEEGLRLMIRKEFFHR
jgi:hypothetical protein